MLQGKVFFDTRLALFIHLIIVLSLGFIVPNSFEFIFLQMIAGIIATQSITQFYRRANIFIAVSQILLVYFLAYFSFSVIQEGNFKGLELIVVGLFILNGLFILFVLPLIYIYEKVFGLGLGPELILGDFKNKNFDYTRISIFPFYKFKSGDSVFKFDQNYDKFTLDIAFDQQFFGPVVLKSNGTLNLTSDSEDYGEFINSKISLNWKKRSYEFGIFYQPHNQSGGISFGLFGFK